MANKSTSTGTAKARKPRTVVNLPASVASATDVAWPGQTRNKANNPLRTQLIGEISAMQLESVRVYDTQGWTEAEVKAFQTLFRAVTKNVHGGKLGARFANGANGELFVKLDEAITRPRKAK